MLAIVTDPNAQFVFVAAVGIVTTVIAGGVLGVVAQLWQINASLARLTAIVGAVKEDIERVSGRQDSIERRVEVLERGKSKQ